MIRTYVRPATVDEAVELLAEPEAAVLAGGTDLNGDAAGAPPVVIDLQDLGLVGIETNGPVLRLGAMTTLQALAETEAVPPLLRDLAVREAPSTIRRAATVAGTIGSSDPESELLAGLLLFEATVTMATQSGSVDVDLADVLDDPSKLGGSVITAITVTTDGTAAADRTGRTPKDRPIVMVAGRSTAGGEIRLVATGVASTPICIDVDTIDELAPPGDFRGSPGYRRHLARVLSSRVVRALEGGRS